MKSILTTVGVMGLFAGMAQNNVGIGTMTPNSKAVLDVESNDKGVLIPRLTTLARTTLGSTLTITEDGMLVYDRDLTTFFYWDGTLLQWVQVGSGTGDDWGIQVVQTSGGNISGNGTAANPLIVVDGDSDSNNEIELPVGGISGQVLSTDGSGIYTWVSDNIGTDDQNITNLTFDNTTNILTVGIENGTAQIVDLTSLLNDADFDVTNEIQDLSLNTTTNILTITNNGTATSIDLSPYLDNVDAQTLSLSGQTLSISNGNAVTLIDNVNDADADNTNEIQTISKTGNVVTLSNGGGTFIDDDTQLSEAQVDLYVSNNGYLTSFVEVDGDVTNEIELPPGGVSGQVLSTDGNGSYTWVNDNLGTDAQTLSLSGQTLSISNGNTVTLTDNINDADADNTNELQTISKTGNVVTLSNGGGTFIDSDTQLSEAQVDNYVNNNGYLTSFVEVDGSITNELQDLTVGGGTSSSSVININGGSGVTIEAIDNITITETGNTIRIGGGTPSGAIFAFPVSTPPSGYLACNGQAVSRSTYANLFALIGTSYGTGNGSTTFNLPNYNGQFLRGWDNGAGIDPEASSRTNRGDGTTGDAVGTRQANQTLAHNHTVNPPATNTNSTGAHLHSVNPPATSTNSTGAHSHTVNPPATNTNSSGAHVHTVNPPATNTNSAGSHSHTIDPPTTTTNTTGAHNHALRNGSGGSHTNSIGNNSLSGQDNSSGWYRSTSIMTNDGDHSHTVNIPAFTSSTAGNHAHSIDIAQFNSGSSGSHVHSVDIAQFSSGANGNHSHTVDIAQFNSGAAGNHSHSVDIAQFNSGNNGGAETRPTNITVLWCIKF